MESLNMVKDDSYCNEIVRIYNPIKAFSGGERHWKPVVSILKISIDKQDKAGDLRILDCQSPIEFKECLSMIDTEISRVVDPTDDIRYFKIS